jgi:hypothetical protein
MWAFDMFSADIEGFPPEIIMGIIIDFRGRTLRKSANHMLKKIKSHNNELYQEMLKYYVKPSIMSYVKPITAKPKQIAAMVWNRLKNRG